MLDDAGKQTNFGTGEGGPDRLDGAQLQGASLERAELQGAWLEWAELQGASLFGAQLGGVWLQDVFVWRADALGADWNGAHVSGSEIGRKRACHNIDPDEDPFPGRVCDWTPEFSEKFKRLIADWIRPEDVERIDRRLDPTKALEGEDKLAQVWADSEQSSRAKGVSRKNVEKQWVKNVAELWLKIGCAADGAPYVVRTLLARAREPFFPRQNPQVRKVAAAFLDTEHCPGARGLSENEIAKLKELAEIAAKAQAPPPAPKQ